MALIKYKCMRTCLKDVLQFERVVDSQVKEAQRGGYSTSGRLGAAEA